MKKLLLTLPFLVLLTSCNKESTKIGCPFYSYQLFVKVLNADGSNVLSGRPTGYLKENDTFEFRYDPELFGMPVQCVLYKTDEDLLWVFLMTGDNRKISTSTPEYALRSVSLFNDDELHTFHYTLAASPDDDYILLATALTFDGRTIEPDADGVFVIRLAQ